MSNKNFGFKIDDSEKIKEPFGINKSNFALEMERCINSKTTPVNSKNKKLSFNKKSESNFASEIKKGMKKRNS